MAAHYGKAPSILPPSPECSPQSTMGRILESHRFSQTCPQALFILLLFQINQWERQLQSLGFTGGAEQLGNVHYRRHPRQTALSLPSSKGDFTSPY